MPKTNSAPSIPWLPLLALCRGCKNTERSPGRPTHEPHDILPALFDALRLAPSMGLVVDVGTSTDMSEGIFALGRGFKVIGIEARHKIHRHLMEVHNRSIASGNLTLLHAAAGSVPGGVVTIHNARDASSVHTNNAIRRYIEHTNPLVKEAVVMTTVDSIVGNQGCAMLKLDIQGAEYDALLGAQALLRRPAGSAPLVLYEEYETLRPDLRNLPSLRLLRSHGYVCYDVRSYPGYRLSDGSIMHRRRYCASLDGRGGCAEWADDETGDAGHIKGTLATDFACAKPPPGTTALEMEARGRKAAEELFPRQSGSGTTG